MDDRKLEIIQQLMDELKSEMEPGHDDLASRLGRPKKIEMMSISGKAMPGEPDGDETDPDTDKPDLMGSLGMGAPSDDEDVPVSPEEKLKERLMKMRG